MLLQVLIDAVVHAVNEDYDEMAGDFIKLGFLSPGDPCIPFSVCFSHGVLHVSSVWHSPAFSSQCRT